MTSTGTVALSPRAVTAVSAAEAEGAHATSAMGVKMSAALLSREQGAFLPRSGPSALPRIDDTAKWMADSQTQRRLSFLIPSGSQQRPSTSVIQDLGLLIE